MHYLSYFFGVELQVRGYFEAKFHLPIFATANRHDQLLLNPPGAEASKGRWL